MNKIEFLEAVRDRIKGLPSEDIEMSLEYYSEMIDDRLEDGLSEEEAVAAMGPVEDVVSQIFMSMPLSKVVKVTDEPRRSNAKKVLLILTSPLWIISIAVFYILYAALWVAIGALYAGAGAVIIAGSAAVFGGIFIGGNALVYIGGGFICVGIGILMILLINLLTKACGKLGGVISRFIKSWFIRKGK